MITAENITDADLATEIEEKEQIRQSIRESRARAAALALEEKKKPRRKKRLELEQRFIGRLINEANETGDIRFIIAKLTDEYDINWRRFIDRRHRAIWRALETMNLLSIEERKKIIEEEAYANAVSNNMNDVPGDDLVRGQPGSAAEKTFEKKLQEESTKAITWFERELAAADAFKVVGGKVYLRLIAEIGDREICFPGQLAGMMNGR